MENIKNSIIMPPLYFKCKHPEINNQVTLVIINTLRDILIFSHQYEYKNSLTTMDVNFR